MTYEWKILDIYADSDSQITEVRYQISLIDGDNVVSTENYWNSDNENQIKLFPEITESQVVYFIENSSQDIITAIKSRLNEQLAVVKSQNQPVRAPWLGAETFTVQL